MTLRRAVAYPLGVSAVAVPSRSPRWRWLRDIGISAALAAFLIAGT
jgi:tellurite resistance protein TehA-like permease